MNKHIDTPKAKSALNSLIGDTQFTLPQIILS